MLRSSSLEPLDGCLTVSDPLSDPYQIFLGSTYVRPLRFFGGSFRGCRHFERVSRPTSSLMPKKISS